MKKGSNLVTLGLIVSTVALNAGTMQASAQESKETEENNVSSENIESTENKDNNVSSENGNQTSDIVLDNSDNQSSIKKISIESAVKESNSTVSTDKDSLPKKEDKKEDSFVAHIYVYTSSGVKTIVLSDKDNNVLEALKTNNVSYHNLKTATGESVDLKDNTGLKNGESLVLFSNQYENSIEEVEMEVPVKYVDDNTLFEGEEKIEFEGTTGKALQTTVTTENISLNGEINVKFQEASKNEVVLKNTESTLTVLEAPQAKVIKRGTVERPVLTISEEESRAFSSSSITSGTAVVGSVGEGTIGKNYAKEISALQSSTQNAAVALALEQVGKAYVWGAVGPSAFDCSGLIQWVYKTNLGKNIPRLAEDQGRFGTPVSWSDIQPGDVIWSSGHIGMYAGNGKMVHASNPTRGVVIDGIDWAKNSGFQVARFE